MSVDIQVPSEVVKSISLGVPRALVTSQAGSGVCAARGSAASGMRAAARSAVQRECMDVPARNGWRGGTVEDRGRAEALQGGGLRADSPGGLTGFLLTGRRARLSLGRS